jgi:hypothetical protein
MALTPEQQRQVQIARKMSENFWADMGPRLRDYAETCNKIAGNSEHLPKQVVEQDQEENSRLMALLAEVAQKKGEE